MLCVSGLDPSGGAGLAADLASVSARGGHGLPLVSALTVQNSRGATRVDAVEAGLLEEQFRALADDAPFAAIKIGLLASPAQVELIAGWLDELGVPVVLDPVRCASSGQVLMDADATATVRDRLLPCLDVITPNHDEALALARGADDVAAAGEALRAAGCTQVLITGGDDDDGTNTVTDCWWPADGPPQRLSHPRVPGRFRGTGCTLSSALATELARGREPLDAVLRARDYLIGTLQCAYAAGPGARMPQR